MTGEDVIQWLADLRSAGIVSSDREAAELIGLDKVRIAQMKTNGTQKRQTDLACAAVLAGLKPYPERGETKMSETLIDAVRGNLHPAANPAVVELALAALGHRDLADRLSSDMTRLQETIKLDQAEIEAAGGWLATFENREGKYTAELQRRKAELWETVAQVMDRLGFNRA
jgi:hypothetical protein